MITIPLLGYALPIGKDIGRNFMKVLLEITCLYVVLRWVLLRKLPCQTMKRNRLNNRLNNRLFFPGAHVCRMDFDLNCCFETSCCDILLDLQKAKQESISTIPHGPAEVLDMQNRLKQSISLPIKLINMTTKISVLVKKKANTMTNQCHKMAINE